MFSPSWMPAAPVDPRAPSPFPTRTCTPFILVPKSSCLTFKPATRVLTVRIVTKAMLSFDCHLSSEFGWSAVDKAAFHVIVHNTEANRCRSSGALSLADEHGFLALPPPSIGSVKGSLADSSANQLLTGTPLCPWLLTVARGRHINITLYNFGLTVQHLSPHLAISGDNRSVAMTLTLILSQ